MSDSKKVRTKIEPSKTPTLERCPFCGTELDYTEHSDRMVRYYFCPNLECPVSGCKSGYNLDDYPSQIAAHNQLCEYVRLGKAAEKFIENPPKMNHNIFLPQYEQGFDYGVRACRDMFKVEEE